MNNFSGIGNVGANLHFANTKSGVAVLNFSIAIDKPGSDTPNWFPVVVFGPDAEHQNKHLRPGMRIGITGRLNSREFTDNKGIKHTVVEILSDRIDWLSRPRDREETATAG